MNARQLAEYTFGLIGVKKMEQPLQAAELQDFINTVNLLLKAWQAQGMHLWKEEEGILFLTPGQESYSIGPGGDQCCDIDNFASTTLNQNVTTGLFTIAVASSSGMQTGDFIGIELDDGSRLWTTIASVPSPLSVTLSTLFSGSVIPGSIGNSIYSYSSLINRPLRILSFRRKTFGQDNEIPVEIWSRQEYFNQVNKASQGTVVGAYYSPQLTNGKLYVWQTASSVNDLLRFTYEDPIQDIDLATNDLDIPVEWLECVAYNCAERLCDTYDVPMEKVSTVSAKAALYLENLLGFDQEMTSINIQPYAKNRR